MAWNSMAWHQQLGIDGDFIRMLASISGSESCASPHQGRHLSSPSGSLVISWSDLSTRRTMTRQRLMDVICIPILSLMPAGHQEVAKLDRRFDSIRFDSIWLDLLSDCWQSKSLWGTRWRCLISDIWYLISDIWYLTVKCRESTSRRSAGDAAFWKAYLAGYLLYKRYRRKGFVGQS
jgi:hypothetical protein